MAELLLDAGADFSSRCTLGEQPLHAQSARGRTEVVSAILQRGCEVHARVRLGKAADKDSSGPTTAVQLATKAGHLETAALLFAPVAVCRKIGSQRALRPARSLAKRIASGMLGGLLRYDTLCCRAVGVDADTLELGPRCFAFHKQGGKR